LAQAVPSWLEPDRLQRLTPAMEVDTREVAATMVRLLASAKTWIFVISACLFYLFPVVLLAWTAVEGARARAGERPLCGNDGRGTDCLRRCLRHQCKIAEEREDCCSGSCFEASSSKSHNAMKQQQRFHGVGGVAIAAAACAVLRSRNALRALWQAGVFAVLALRLVIYALILAPWFLRVGYLYFHNPHIFRGVCYGPQPRNLLDLYLPEEALSAMKDGNMAKSPIVVTVMGGGWVIGYRLWNILLGMRLAQAGVLVAAVDYRNFPGAYMHDMVEDVDHAVGWVLANAASYGGDRKQLLLVGQSAGAHLAAQALLQRACGSCLGVSTGSKWSHEDIKGFVGVSGPYDLVALQEHLKARGLHPFLHRLCAGGHSDLARLSPTQMVPKAKRAVPQLPPFHLFTGEDDRSVPPALSVAFGAALRAAGTTRVTVEIRPKLLHAEAVVEDPLTGGDLQPELLLTRLLGETAGRARLAALPPPPYPLVPGLLARIAKRLMPF